MDGYGYSRIKNAAYRVAIAAPVQTFDRTSLLRRMPQAQAHTKHVKALFKEVVQGIVAFDDFVAHLFIHGVLDFVEFVAELGM